jgi:hypothetical protein
METVPLDIVQAFFHVDTGLLLTAHQLERFEGGPRSVLDRQIAALAVAAEAEYTPFASKDMNLHNSPVRVQLYLALKDWKKRRWPQRMPDTSNGWPGNTPESVATSTGIFFEFGQL